MDNQALSNVNEQTKTEYVLEMRHMTKEFPGVKALDDVTIKIRPGTVHSLMGENGAGKSTLMKCLFGIYKPDKGQIYLDGKNVSFSSPSEALESHVTMVHQELNQVLHRSVMENVWLGRYPIKGAFVDHKKMYAETKKIFQDLNIDIDPKVKVGSLSVSQKQMVEIAKAVSYMSKVIVMDEPTSSLTEKEVNHLFKIIARLIEKNTSIIYISHKMEEILQISHEVTVMRDGKYIATEKAEALTTDRIIKMMVGRELTERYPKKEAELVDRDILMEVQEVSTLYPAFSDVSFSLRKGEILGIAGLVGSKRTEVLESLFGLRQLKAGKIILNGNTIKNSSPLESIKNGFAFLTEERRSDGIFEDLSVASNLIISNLNSYLSKGRLLKDSLIKTDVGKMIKAMNIKTPSGKTKIGNLSGGNQQKAILGRWLLTNPEVLLLDEPTRGIDVGAKYEIYQLINQLALQKKGIIIVSSEMPELLGICDRILIMSNGRQAEIVDAKTTSQEEIMAYSAKYI